MAFDQGDAKFTGNAFVLAIEEVGTQIQRPTFAQPVTITIHYSDQGPNGLLAEESYQLMQDVAGRWQALPLEKQVNVNRNVNRAARNPAENTFAIAMHAPGRYALFGKAHAAYLPWITQ